MFVVHVRIFHQLKVLKYSVSRKYHTYFRNCKLENQRPRSKSFAVSMHKNWVIFKVDQKAYSTRKHLLFAEFLVQTRKKTSAPVLWGPKMGLLINCQSKYVVFHTSHTFKWKCHCDERAFQLTLPASASTSLKAK